MDVFKANVKNRSTTKTLTKTCEEIQKYNVVSLVLTTILIRHIHKVHSTNQVGRGYRKSNREKSQNARLRRRFEIKSVISWHLMGSVEMHFLTAFWCDCMGKKIVTNFRFLLLQPNFQEMLLKREKSFSFSILCTFTYHLKKTLFLRCYQIFWLIFVILRFFSEKCWVSMIGLIFFWEDHFIHFKMRYCRPYCCTWLSRYKINFRCGKFRLFFISFM